MSNLSPLDRATLSLSYNDYLRFSTLMQDRYGLAFPEKRRMELEIGVRRAFAASTCPDLESYYRILLDPAHCDMELERLVNFLTVGETHFFRDAGQFDALVNTVLPEIIERKRATHTLRFWSAGCASGEEPYSLAMLLRDMLPDIETWNITILATDINTQNLERAHRGLYGEWAFRETRAKTMRPRYFIQRGNQYELSPVIRKMVRFTGLNLAEDSYPSYENNTMFMDMIVCRNVTIYFPETVTRTVVDRYYNALVDGGWLVIGHSEHSLDTYKRFKVRNFPDAILYQRLPDTATKEASSPNHLPPLGQPASVPFPPVTLTSTSKPAVPESPSGTPASQTAPSSTVPKNGTQPSKTPAIPTHMPPPLPPSIQQSDFEQAQTLINDGHVDQARDLLLRWLAEHPTHAPGCALLGKAYANLGNWPEAERWCKMAIAHERLNLEAYYTLALVFQHQGQRDQALEMMKKVVYIDRNDILGHFSLADLFYSSGQKVQALKSLENARRLLESKPIDDLVPRSRDITIGRLAETVIELQQNWSIEIAKEIKVN